MKTSDGSFELIMQELFKQKQHSEKLQEENEEMRRQLADLRAGCAISIDILGQRFLLDITSPAKGAMLQTAPVVYQEPTTVALEVPAIPVVEARLADERITEAPTVPPSPSAELLEERKLDQVASATTSASLAVLPGPGKKSSTQGEEEKEALRRELMGSFLLE